MELKYTKMYPMGNSTVLIWDLANTLNPKDFHSYASKIMMQKNLPCEQVGFIRRPKGENSIYRLEMMGGELCVNALRSLAYLHYSQNGDLCFNLESSGSEEVFHVQIGEANAVTNLSFNMKINFLKKNENLSLVHLDGISHFVELLPEFHLTEDQISNRLNSLMDQYSKDLEGVEAIGYIPFQKGKNSYKITPLVFVKGTNTRILETACGSGTIAVSVHEFEYDQGGLFNIQQPTGAFFTTTIEKDDSGCYKLAIESKVDLISKGVLYLK